ncbi:hypothetical protein FC57_GL001280 [Lactobacillus ultunensis DSM 16047]|nr:hypothetical protein FC57_GL001280 [Lactobacillus ultunensis DSM 16047]
MIAGLVGATSATPNFGAVKLAASVTEALTPNKLIEATATETTLTNFFESNIMNTSNFYIT